MSDETDKPVLRIVNPDATPEEIAAIVTVFAGLGGSNERPRPEPQSVWGHHHYKHRVTYRRGPGAWVASGRPH